MSVGYATLYGDMAGGLNLLGDLYKTEVFELARWYNAYKGRPAIPERILTKPPSAELSPDQKDSDSLPAYPLLDAILKLYLEGHRLRAKEKDAAECIVAGHIAEHGPSEVERVRRMVARAEFKRSQAPPIIRVRARAFGSGRQIPISARA
jgi:NAD+ synthetase